MKISTDELKALMKRGGFVLLDIREPHELVHGMLPGAINLPLSEFEDAFSLPWTEFSKRYGFDPHNSLMVVYCRTGGRSGRATKFLEEKGFDVRDYSGSVQEWSEFDKNVHMY